VAIMKVNSIKLLIQKLSVRVKQKIKDWLFADELKDIQQIKKEYKYVIETYKRSKNLLTEAYNEHMKSRDIIVDCQKFMNSICDVGTDIGFYNDHSWAVICVHGKVDYVKFVDMRREDVMSIVKFLKDFEYSNRVTDSPLGYKPMLEDMIIKF
jgi:hypothetical protein